MLPLVVNPDAEADLAEAKAWYESRSAQATEHFLSRVNEVFERIQSMPTLYAKAFQELRVGRVHRFP